MQQEMRIARYLRLSIEDKREGMEESNSIANQRKMISHYISNSLELSGKEVWEFCDDGFSGTNMERPGMKKLLEAVKKNQVRCIIVKDMSRFSRDYIELGNYLNQIFPFLGVRFISINDHYDSREQGGKTIAIDTAFQTLVYDLYSKDLSVKLKAALGSKSEAGEYVFSQLPFGYERSRKVKNQVVVNEKEAAIVKYIFSLAADGKSTTQIAKILHSEKIPTAMEMRRCGQEQEKKNLSWSAQKVRKILNNRFYVGDMIYGKSVRESVGSKKAVMVPKREWKIISNHHEPLVSPEVFALVSAPYADQEGRQRKERYSLAGKVFCGGCGYAMNYKKPSERKPYLQFWCQKHTILQIQECCTYFNGTTLEEVVLCLLYYELEKQGDMGSLRKRLEQFQKNHLVSIEKSWRECRKQKGKIQKEKDELYEQYAAKKIMAEEYRCMADKLEEQMLKLKEEEKKLEKEHFHEEESYKAEKQDIEQIIHCFHMERLTRKAADIFIKKIYVYRGRKVKILWNFSENGSAGSFT